MGETVAYELAQLPSEKQYEALDQLIDAGVNYETADIKTVQRIKRKVEAGESTKQDLAAEAEKRGIQCPDGDYSPLLAALVADAIPPGYRKGLRRCRTKAEGLEYLHRFGLEPVSSWGRDVCYDSDPQALTIKKPICRRIKWAEVWDLLALWDMHGAGSSPVEAYTLAGGPARTPAPTREREAAAAPEGWHKCSTDTPPEGQTVCVVEVNKDGSYFADVYVYTDGVYCDADDVTENGEQYVRKDAWWFPVPEIVREMANG